MLCLRLGSTWVDRSTTKHCVACYTPHHLNQMKKHTNNNLPRGIHGPNTSGHKPTKHVFTSRHSLMQPHRQAPSYPANANAYPIPQWIALTSCTSDACTDTKCHLYNPMQSLRAMDINFDISCLQILYYHCQDIASFCLCEDRFSKTPDSLICTIYSRYLSAAGGCFWVEGVAHSTPPDSLLIPHLPHMDVHNSWYLLPLAASIKEVVSKTLQPTWNESIKSPMQL